MSDEEKVKNYILRGIKATFLSKKFYNKFLLTNICIFIIAKCFYHEIFSVLINIFFHDLCNCIKLILI